MNAITKEFTDAVEKQFATLNADVQAALKEAKAAQAIVDEFEQKLARGVLSGGFGGEESWGQQVAESEGLKSLAAIATSQPGRVRIEVKDITSGAASGGSLSVPGRDPNVNIGPMRSVRVRDLLNVVPTNQGAVDYVDQTLRANNAAPQGEGALKAESDYAFDLKTTPIRTIAHWVRASVQVLADAPQLQGIIDGELRYGLTLAEDTQLLAGDGVAPNVSGLITNAAAYAPAFAPAGETMLDRVGLGILQVALAGFIPNGIAVSQSDWMRMRLLKDADGKYILGDPQAVVQPVLFGLPVAVTPAMAVDKFLVGDFIRAATMYDRQEPTVQLSTEDRDNFVRNLVTVRAEERIGLALKNADALSYGDFGNVA